LHSKGFIKSFPSCMFQRYGSFESNEITWRSQSTRVEMYLCWS
jgi:hypothetical protein